MIAPSHSKMIIFLLFSGSIFCFDLIRDLQETVDEFQSQNPSAPGVSAFVECPSLGLKWSGASGTSELNGNEAMLPQHAFRIASNTKTYVATAVLRLVEDGKLKLADTLDDLLKPGIKEVLRKDGYDLESMTLAMVLSHTSGLSEHAGDDRYAQAIMDEPFRHWTPQEQIELCVKWFDPVGKPGERYAYSDTGYILLGLIVEQKTHQELGPAVRQLINYDKAGLKNTFWEYMEPEPKGLLRAHQYYGEKDITAWHASFDLYGGGGLLSTPEDMGTFMRLLLQGRIFHSKETLESMLQGGTKSYRLGLMRIELDGFEAFGHQGFWNTFAYYVPSIETTVAGCITDHFAKNGRALANQLVERVAKKLE